jgi:bifunctional N-acetylglucosamine-1-phosphate-uridyltransferase/glucosamine-1-phosphate-acetyltransferase GlmU-like protein
VQPVARGTGDAVLCAEAEIAQHEGHSLVVWGTQPVIQVQTFKRMLALAALFPDYQMFVPTAFGEKPYAPLLRKAGGEVATAVETHLQKAHTVPFGETNLGLFTLKSQSMLRILGGLRAASFDAATGVYRRPGGELGFPNELISALAQEPSGVLASPLADIRETQGIKCKDDVALCERYRAELR